MANLEISQDRLHLGERFTVSFQRTLRIPAAQTMGLGAGGMMQQKISPDPCGIDAWDQDNYQRVFIHILHSAQCSAMTGSAPPPTPSDIQAYRVRDGRAGMSLPDTTAEYSAHS
ncbi:MAG TPA: hypothetical protein VI542_17145 [Candidatus Tectomicrobia bacterium]